MRILGFNALNHDAAVCVIEDGEILFGAHSERYSGKKNDPNLNQEIVDEALSFGEIDKIAWFEKPYLKKDTTTLCRSVFNCFLKRRYSKVISKTVRYKSKNTICSSPPITRISRILHFTI